MSKKRISDNLIESPKKKQKIQQSLITFPITLTYKELEDFMVRVKILHTFDLIKKKKMKDYIF